MELNAFDGKTVRLIATDGLIFEGPAEWDHREYNMHEYGVDEESLSLYSWKFFASQIVQITEIPDHTASVFYSRPMHRIPVSADLFERVEQGRRMVEIPLQKEKADILAEQDMILLENQRDDLDLFFGIAERKEETPEGLCRLWFRELE